MIKGASRRCARENRSSTPTLPLSIPIRRLHPTSASRSKYTSMVAVGQRRLRTIVPLEVVIVVVVVVIVVVVVVVVIVVVVIVVAAAN